MTNNNHLYSPLDIKSIKFKNRIWVSPMCQYSSINGHPTDWHLVHLGSRAVGGAGLILVEATAVSPEGRISPDDSGIWSDDHIQSFKRITEFVTSTGAICGVQLAHAGRKASTAAPWLGGKFLNKNERGWDTIAPSAIPFHKTDPSPRAMTQTDIERVIKDFEQATIRSLKAGFQTIELHMAHGYLMHEFLSPNSNQRTDEYGGSLENRMRLPLAVARAVRANWPQELPLFVRISATDWVHGSDEYDNHSLDETNWNLSSAIIFCRELKKLGIDLIDCSSGGNLSHAKIPLTPGYQVPFARAIKNESNILTAAVGLITEPEQAEQIVANYDADAVLIARESLRDPYWPYRAAKALGVPFEIPNQYARAW